MKKYLLLILLAFFCLGAGRMWDYGETNLYGIGNLTWVDQVDSGGAACQSGTYGGAWDGDYSGDTDKMCVNSGASTKDGSVNGATISTDYGESGYGVLIDAADEYVEWTAASNDIIEEDEGTVWCSLKAVTTTGTSIIWEIWDSSENYVVGMIDSNGYLTLEHRGQGNRVSVTGNDAVSDNTWTRVAFSWSVGSNQTSVQVASNGWDADGDPDTVTVFVGDCPHWRAGNYESNVFGDNADDLWIDDCYLIHSYQAADPG